MGISHPLQAQTPAETEVSNTVQLTFETDDGSLHESEAVATLSVGQFARLSLHPSRTAEGEGGQRYTFSHTLQNNGNGSDEFELAAVSDAGWSVTLYRDEDGDGRLSAPDTPVGGPISLDAGEQAALLLTVDAPEVDGPRTDRLRIDATSLADPSVTASVENRLSVGIPPVEVALTKTVEPALATTGDTLTYRVQWATGGSGGSANLVVTDTLPDGLAYVDGSLDAAGDGGKVEEGVVRVQPGTVGPEEKGSFSFLAIVTTDADSLQLENVATARVTGGGVDATSRSAPAATAVRRPRLQAEKRVEGPDSVFVGDELTFRLLVENPDDVPARSVEIRDSLPAGLDYVSSNPTGEAQGREIEWALGDIAPGVRHEITIVTRVTRTASEQDSLVNRALVGGTNTEISTITSQSIASLGWRGDELGLEKQAEAVEADPADPVPYRLTLTNQSEQAALTGLRVRDRLPEGTRYLPGSLVGADSVHTSGRSLEVFVNRLEPGGEHVLRYAVALVNPPAGGVLENVATGEAEAGLVRSQEARSRVRVRDRWPMATRAVLGRIWIDRNGNGVQDEGEPGVRDVRIWSEGGTVVRADGHGGFSFRDLRPGRHTFRLDPESLPDSLAPATPDAGTVTLDAGGWTTPRALFPLTVDRPSSLEEAEVRFPERRRALSGSALMTRQQRSSTARDGPRLTSPARDTVIATNRLYVGALGEPGDSARLFDGDVEIARGTFRPDGIHDFVAVPLETAGPHELRLVTPAGADTVRVHVAGSPAAFDEVPEGPLGVAREAPLPTPLRVRVLDRWGQPADPSHPVTVYGDGVKLANLEKMNPNRTGGSAHPDPDGWLELDVRAGSDVGSGAVALEVGDLHQRVPVDVLPEIRPLIVSGHGQVGIGASPDPHGALTAKGKLDDRTSLTVRYDSRREGDRDDVFGRSVDPLDEAQYPVLGDASRRHEEVASRGSFAARLERGLDWVSVGDVRSEEVLGDLDLLAYPRALTGAAGRVSTGEVTWSTFGSLTSQDLEERQIRGEGTSGPYDLPSNLRPGTERVVVETRQDDNAELVLTRQRLTRYVDYEIDYDEGALLLHRAVPSSDPSGNPIFITVTYEVASGGPRDLVGGARISWYPEGLAGAVGADSVVVGATGVRGGERPGGGRHVMGGLDVRVEGERLELFAEAGYTSHGDVAGLGFVGEGSLEIAEDVLYLDGRWMRLDDGFTNPAQSRLQGGSEHLDGELELTPVDGTRFHLRHSRQSFEELGADRARTEARASQELPGGLRMEAALADDRFSGQGAGASDRDERQRSLEGRLGWQVTERMDLFVEGRTQLSATERAPRPDAVGGGISYRVSEDLSVEASHRRMTPDSGGAYTVTSVGMRGQLFTGTDAWGRYRLAGLQDGMRGAATVGLGQHLRLGPWSLDGMIERRQNLESASLGDPDRALPFPREEQDRLSTSLGVEFVPEEDVRMSARGELTDGDARSHELVEMAGEIAIGDDAALLGRARRIVTDQERREGHLETREHRALLGLAIRPSHSSAWNALLKVEARGREGPALGASVLAAEGGEDRWIGAAEVLWAPSAGVEIGLRHALRFTDADRPAGPLEGGVGEDVQRLSSRAHFTGVRARWNLGGPLTAQLDGRLLAEAATRSVRWDAAPALRADVFGPFTLEGGYRFGELRDPDFSVRGGDGWYLTAGFQLDESTVQDVAGFWRHRLGW